MNDQLFESTKQAVLACAERWTVLLGLDQWTIRYEFTRGSIADPGASGTWQGLARTSANWPYLTAMIEFGLEGFADMRPGDLEHHVVHELVHVLLDELEPDTSDVELWRRNEHAVELVARSLIRAKHLGAL